MLSTALLLGLLAVVNRRHPSQEPQPTAMAFTLPSAQDVERPGLVFSDRDGHKPRSSSLSFWMLHKSKKVWFRVPDAAPGSDLQPMLLYRGRRILFGGDLANLSPSQSQRLKRDSILWGDAVAHGWGVGPEHTNYYLFIWTRWSWLHPAFRSPSRFSLRYRPPTAPERAADRSDG
ncbi:hypothetical protein [Synechococcus sp. RedBA-s]|uniref:hypothetical protein n=1 Tax=Synechococcus sp. RedBA-s TaxID=2823741 RepID=UPI0020CF27B2|nr:hypothetical protein [Synechococcus sp. RedBA-s]MCP9799556.1 hypothetical protein [Synechococcus sp. RedBA-s]